VLHHVSLEVKPGDVERSIEFFDLLGFTHVAAPEPIAAFVTWLEREATQVHLIHTPEAIAPPLGHPAVVASDFDQSVGRLRDAGFDLEPTDALWGKQRAFAIMPGGHRVELMAAPPPATAR
jgi:hypothetical protein